jgi:hypothetical protein
MEHLLEIWMCFATAGYLSKVQRQLKISFQEHNENTSKKTKMEIIGMS